MKKLFLIVTFFTAVTVQNAFALGITSQDADSAKTNQLSVLLSSYYGIKNALVSGNAATAASQASQLVMAMDSVDLKALSATDHDAFKAVQDKLKKDAQAIAASNKIEVQRTAFSTLSDNMYSLVKASKLSVEPAYRQYCPMKKMYWLSSEAAIKNPYYGKMMLTCGKITETIN